MQLKVAARVENAHDEGVWSVCWGGEGDSSLLTGSVDETVKLWDIPTSASVSEGENNIKKEGSLLGVKHTYTGHSLGVVSVVTHVQTGLAATSAVDSVVRVWDLRTNETKATMELPPSEAWVIAFSPDGRHIAVAGGSSESVTVWDVNDSKQVAHLPLSPSSLSSSATNVVVRKNTRVRQTRFVLAVAYSPDGRRLACGAMDGTVCVYDTTTHALVHTVGGHHLPVRSLVFTADSKTLLTACDDMHLHMSDTETGKPIASLAGHSSWLLCVAVPVSDTTTTKAVSGSSDRSVRLWDLTTRTCERVAKEHTDHVWGVAFSEDGKRAASVSDDKSVVVYDVVDGNKTVEISVL